MNLFLSISFEYVSITMQTWLGESKKKHYGNENVLIYVKFNNQKLVFGTLSAERSAQIQYGLVFEKEFELSYSSNNASIYLCCYKTIVLKEDEYLYDFPVESKFSLYISNAQCKQMLAIVELNKADKQKANRDVDEDDDDEDDKDEDEDGGG